MSFPSLCLQHFDTFVACQVGKCLEGGIGQKEMWLLAGLIISLCVE